jgi:hypothetical protein
MVFLDYDTVTFTLSGGSGSVYTAPYKCMVSLEVVSSSGDPFALTVNDDQGFYVLQPSNERHYLSRQIEFSTQVVFDGGTIVMKSGDVLQRAVTISSGSVTFRLHIFRLPESP